jgi:hypothetical protein
MQRYLSLLSFRKYDKTEQESTGNSLKDFLKDINNQNLELENELISKQNEVKKQKEE